MGIAGKAISGKIFMKNNVKIFAKVISLSLFSLMIAACDKQPVISYSNDVKPVLDQHCLECHTTEGAGTLASGFSMANYEDLMKGTKFGPMVIANDPEGSNLLVLIEGRADPSISMPHGKKSIPKQDIQTIRSWIRQGAKNN